MTDTIVQPAPSVASPTVKVKPLSEVHGLLPMFKPRGMISKDMSRWLENKFGRLKLGHAGTLDPNADGILPILLGNATRLQDFLVDLPKTYEFTVKFGVETDTLDSDGIQLRELPWDMVSRELIEAHLPKFRGTIKQTPPIFSAVKYKGKALYEYARAGRGDEVPLAELARDVHVSSFELLTVQDQFATFRVSCSRGTYIRCLVRDLAVAMGTCGTVIELRRTEASGLTMADTVTIETIEANPEAVVSHVKQLHQLSVRGLPRWSLPDLRQMEMLRRGQPVVMDIHENPTAETIESWAKPVLLASRDAAVFGLGSARLNDHGRIQLNLTRGL